MKNRFDKLRRDVSMKDINISARNRDFIDRFTRHLQVSKARENKYRYSLFRFAGLIEKDFDKVTEQEIIDASKIINAGNLAVKTKQDIISEMRAAYKFWLGKNLFYPQVIAGLKAPASKGKLRLPDEMPSEEEIYKMIKACGNVRDKFFIALIALDGALRPIECRRIVWGDIKKDQYGHFIVVKTAKESGDKDTRVIRIIKSEPYFMRWSQEYPGEKTDNAYVFINYSDLKPISQGTISALFGRLKKKLGIKRLYPYLLRHALLTNMSKDPRVPISLLKKFAGHSLASNTIAEYQHFGDDDLKDMQLQVNGIVKKEGKKDRERKPVKCPKCKKMNEYDAEFCIYCNMALSQRRQVESYEKLNGIEKEVRGLKESDKTVAGKLDRLLNFFQNNPKIAKQLAKEKELIEIFR